MIFSVACEGVPNTNWACCSNASPCNVGRGDCDSDDECLGDLICIRDSCRDDYNSTVSNWDIGTDCCSDSRSKFALVNACSNQFSLIQKW